MSQQVKVTNFEVPDSVKVGEDAELKCDTEGKESSGFVLKWWFTPLDKDVQYPIYQRITGKNSMVSPKFTDSISEFTVLVSILKLK